MPDTPTAARRFCSYLCALALTLPGAAAAQTEEMTLAANTRRQLQRALSNGDMAGFLALFTADAELRAGRSHVTGREAIGVALAEAARSVTSAVLSMGPEHFDICSDGAVEWGGRYTMVLEGGRADTVRGSYALHWLREGGELRVRALTLAAASSQPRMRCTLRSAAGYRTARVVVGASFPLPIGGSRVGPSIGDEMASRGYPEGSQELDGSAHRSKDGGTPILASVRARAMGRVWIEALVSVTNYGALALRRVSNVNWRAANDSRAHALLAALEWHSLRVGAGPAVVRSHWTSGTGLDTSGDSAWTTSSAGFAVQGVAFYPVSRRVVLEARGTAFRVAATTIPATGQAAAVTGVNNNVMWLGIGAGFVF